MAAGTYIDRDFLYFVGWLVGQEPKSRLNGASYLHRVRKKKGATLFLPVTL